MSRRKARTRHFGNNLRSLFGWRDAARDVRDEMALHADLRTAELQRRGVPAADARRQAEREVGFDADIEPVIRGFAGQTDRSSAWRQRIDETAHDVRHALRLFRRSPGFSLLAVVTIAVGLGANAAIFALVNTLYLQPLPFDPERTLIRVREFRQASDGTRNDVDASRRTADAVAERPDLFKGSVAMVSAHRALLRQEGPLHMQATRVGPGFTRVAGVSPILGRPFTPGEEQAGEAAGAVLISHRLWRTVFGGVPGAIGESIRLDDRSFEIVGVLPPAFHVPYDSDVWFPSRFDEQERSVFILARLAPGVTFEQALGELEAMGPRLNQLYPDLMRGMGVTAVRARDYFIDDDGRIALALMGAVGFLLLIGCANVALLLTTRFAARRREVAVRAALGCGRWRQIRQFVTEAVLVFLAGGALGVVLATWLTDSLTVFLPEAIATQVGLEGILVDGRVVLFASGVSVLAGLCFGLIAALRATGADLHAVMKDAGRSVAGDASRGTLRLLASAEVALAVVLLTAAGTMTETFQRLLQRDLGFEPRGVLTLQAGLEAQRYESAAPRLAFMDALLEQVRTMPAVDAAGFTTVNPLCCGDWGARLSVEGQTYASQAELPIIQHQLVTPGYFDAMRMRLLQGRAFTPDDREGREAVVIVDRRAARRFWPGQEPIGKRLKRGAPNSPTPWLTVVGVVETIEDQGEYIEQWYLPFAQHPVGPSSQTLHLMVRAAEPIALAPSIVAAAAAIDPALAWHDIATMDAVHLDRLQQGHMGAMVTTAFAAAGLLLAVLGLYGVLSFVLAGDTREIGLRLALGARPGAIVRLVLGRGLRLAFWGLVIGTGGAFALSVGLERWVPEVHFNAAIVAGAAGALALAALVATAIPAARALRVDPLEALRAD